MRVVVTRCCERHDNNTRETDFWAAMAGRVLLLSIFFYPSLFFLKPAGWPESPLAVRVQSCRIGAFILAVFWRVPGKRSVAGAFWLVSPAKVK